MSVVSLVIIPFFPVRWTKDGIITREIFRLKNLVTCLFETMKTSDQSAAVIRMINMGTIGAPFLADMFHYAYGQVW